MMYDLIIIGAGILGLSIARRLSADKKDIKLLILEKESEIAMHQSGINSGVIHSGLYYKPRSLKAKNCVNGYKKKIKFCQDEGVDYQVCGKIVVATAKDELPLLDNLYDNGIKNNLKGLRYLDEFEIQE